MAVSFLFNADLTTVSLQPSFANEEGIPERKAVLLIGIEAISGLASVLCFGRIVDCFNNSHLQFYQLGILGIGLVQTFTAVAKAFPLFILLMVHVSWYKRSNLCSSATGFGGGYFGKRQSL